MQNPKKEKFKLSKFELKRQMFHLLLGILIVALLLYDVLNTWIIMLLIAFGLLVSFLSRKARIPVIGCMLREFEREEELNHFPGKGAIFYFIGVFFALLFFEKEVAMASIMVLAFGDSVSHLYGLHYGRIKHPLSSSKFLEGTAAGFVAGFFGALIFLPWHEAFFASFVAMFVEAMEIRIGAQQVDDNIVVPLFAGFTIWVIRALGI